MPIRLATHQDEPAIAALCAAAFFEESLFGQTIHPYRHQYPGDVEIFWHDWMRNDFKERRNMIIVATTTEDGKEKIVGVATWQRQGDDEGANEVTEKWSDPGADAFPPLSSMHNRAMDPSKQTLLQDSASYCKHHWTATTNGLPRSQNWYIHLCAVHPSYHKRGFGQQLVKWGIDRARRENVHASVLASEGNNDFYLRCGFDEVIGNCTEGEGNPLGVAKVKGGDILFMWAKERAVQEP